MSEQAEYYSVGESEIQPGFTSTDAEGQDVIYVEAEYTGPPVTTLEEFHAKQMKDWRYRFWYWAYWPYYWLVLQYCRWKGKRRHNHNYKD